MLINSGPNNQHALDYVTSTGTGGDEDRLESKLEL